MLALKWDSPLVLLPHSDGPICQHLMADEYGGSVKLKLTAEQ